MVYPMLISEKAKKAWKRRIIMGMLVETLILFGFIFYSFMFSDYRNFWIIVLFLITIILFTGMAFFFNYIRTPAEIKRITDEGFEYVTVVGRRREILWNQIIDIRRYDKFGDMFILYKTKTGKEGIEVIYEHGLKLKEAWEEWKKQESMKKSSNIRR